MRLHGHPQLAQYNSSDEWRIFSFQGHWPESDPTMTEHIHVDIKFPYGAEIDSTPFDVPFTLKAFMLDGRIGLFQSDAMTAIKWNDTGTSTPPVMQGDPNSMVPKQWSGVMTIDPQKGRYAHKHGWTQVQFLSRTAFTNGDEMDVQAFNSFFSIAFPELPEEMPPGGFGPVLSCRVVARHKDEQSSFGEMVTEIDDWIPLLPIDKAWYSIINFYNYTAPPENPLTLGQFQERLDPDLHNGILGTLIDSAIADKGGIPNRPIVFDPKIIGIGKHKIAEFWTQNLNEDTVSSLVIFDLEVSAGGQPTVSVPDLTGLTENEANTTLTKIGLKLGSVGLANDQIIPINEIISQFPHKEVSVLIGSTVNIVLSLGPIDTPTEVWVPAVPTFMQLHINGMPQKRWQICGVDNSQTMDDCVEIVTRPDEE